MKRVTDVVAGHVRLLADAAACVGRPAGTFILVAIPLVVGAMGVAAGTTLVVMAPSSVLMSVGCVLLVAADEPE